MLGQLRWLRLRMGRAFPLQRQASLHGQAVEALRGRVHACTGDASYASSSRREAPVPGHPKLVIACETVFGCYRAADAGAPPLVRTVDEYYTWSRCPHASTPSPALSPTFEDPNNHIRGRHPIVRGLKHCTNPRCGRLLDRDVAAVHNMARRVMEGDSPYPRPAVGAPTCRNPPSGCPPLCCAHGRSHSRQSAGRRQLRWQRPAPLRQQAGPPRRRLQLRQRRGSRCSRPRSAASLVSPWSCPCPAARCCRHRGSRARCRNTVHAGSGGERAAPRPARA